MVSTMTLDHSKSLGSDGLGNIFKCYSWFKEMNHGKLFKESWKWIMGDRARKNGRSAGLE